MNSTILGNRRRAAVAGFRLFSALTALAFLAGCGGEPAGPPKFHLSGTVNFDGKPVPFGTIHFDPDAGNKGPQGYAEIREGQFDTRENDGDGVISGKLVARITGFEKEPRTDNDTPIAPLFEEHIVHFEALKQDSARDFEIPRDAAKKTAATASRPMPSGP